MSQRIDFGYVNKAAANIRKVAGEQADNIRREAGLRADAIQNGKNISIYACGGHTIACMNACCTSIESGVPAKI